MCGILFASMLNGSRASKPIAKRFNKQKSRGTQGFGYVTILQNGKIGNVMKSTTEKPILDALSEEKVDTILFHHRNPTSLPNCVEAAHPLVVKSEKLEYDYYVVHNGVLRNETTLFETYKKRGFTFMTELKECSVQEFVNVEGSRYEFEPEIKFNDSECFALDVANFLDGKQDKIESIGTISFIAIQAYKDGTVKNIVYGHNTGNPLILEKDKTIFCLRSEGKGGGIIELPVDTLYTMDWKTKEVTERKINIGFRVYTDKYNNNLPIRAGFNTKGALPNVPPRDVRDWNNDSMFDATKVVTEDSHFRYLDRESPLMPDGSKKSPIQVGHAELLKNIHKERAQKRKDEYEIDTYEGISDPNFDRNISDPDYLSQEADKILASLSMSDAEAVAELTNDLKREQESEREARQEYDDCVKLLNTAYIEEAEQPEKEAAASMVQASKLQWEETKKIVEGTLAELSIYDYTVEEQYSGA